MKIRWTFAKQTVVSAVAMLSAVMTVDAQTPQSKRSTPSNRSSKSVRSTNVKKPAEAPQVAPQPVAPANDQKDQVADAVVEPAAPTKWIKVEPPRRKIPSMEGENGEPLNRKYAIYKWSHKDMTEFINGLMELDQRIKPTAGTFQRVTIADLAELKTKEHYIKDGKRRYDPKEMLAVAERALMDMRGGMTKENALLGSGGEGAEVDSRIRQAADQIAATFMKDKEEFPALQAAGKTHAGSYRTAAFADIDSRRTETGRAFFMFFGGQSSFKFVDYLDERARVAGKAEEERALSELAGRIHRISLEILKWNEIQREIQLELTNQMFSGTRPLIYKRQDTHEGYFSMLLVLDQSIVAAEAAKGIPVPPKFDPEEDAVTEAPEEWLNRQTETPQRKLSRLLTREEAAGGAVSVTTEPSAPRSTGTNPSLPLDPALGDAQTPRAHH